MFIYTADDELQQGGPGHTYRLAAWHNYAAKRLSGLEAKAVKKDVLLQYLRSHGLPASRLDIGIYSSVYVYTGDQRTDELVTGTFCRDPAVVKNYTAVFDQLWTSHQTLPIQRFVKTSLKTEQLFDFDIEPSDPVEEVHAT